MTVGKSALRGRLDLKLSNPLAVGGDVAADDVDVPAVAAILLGLPSAAANATKPWSLAPVGAGAFGAVSGAVTFKFDRAALTPVLVARDFKGIAQFQPAEIALRELDGKVAGGRLIGDSRSAATRRHSPRTAMSSFRARTRQRSCAEQQCR